jgi:hypothetical protein
VDGGWAEMLLANSNAVVALPDSLNAADAAPPSLRGCNHL